MNIVDFLILLAQRPEMQHDFASSPDRARQLMTDLGVDHGSQDLILGVDHAHDHCPVSGTDALEAEIQRELEEKTATQAPAPGVSVAVPLVIFRPT